MAKRKVISPKEQARQYLTSYARVCGCSFQTALQCGATDDMSRDCWNGISELRVEAGLPPLRQQQFDT